MDFSLFVRREYGVAYLALLFFVALMSLGALLASSVWSTLDRREKETRLIYVGTRIREAIGQYYINSPGSFKRYPDSLEDVLLDRRQHNLTRYLRRIYSDPMTGGQNWGLVMAPSGGVMGVYSMSDKKPVRSIGFDGERLHADHYFEWKFAFIPKSRVLPESNAPHK